MKTLDDCLAKLKRLDAKGRLWPQDLMLEVQGGYLLLSDIETKVCSYTLQIKLLKRNLTRNLNKYDTWSKVCGHHNTVEHVMPSILWC